MSSLPQGELINLGATGLQIPAMGTGAWAWGDRFMWGYGRGYSEDQVRGAFDASLEAGINFFDTAEVYGNGRSERFLGEFAPGGATPQGERVIIATKFMPFPWRLRKAALISALRRSLDRLKTEQVDLYQIHFPMPIRSVDTWAEALGEVYQAGLVRAVGVSNYNASQMRRTHGVLARMDLPLASNQVEYSLIQRKPEVEGVLAACQELDITLLAYSPLGKGILTGKYTPESPPPGMRGRQYNRQRLQGVQRLIQRIREIGRDHGAKSPAQVAINWTICKGTVPIPGAKNARQALENAAALGWRLTGEEVAELDVLAGEAV